MTYRVRMLLLYKVLILLFAVGMSLGLLWGTHQVVSIAQVDDWPLIGGRPGLIYRMPRAMPTVTATPTVLVAH